MTENIHGDNQKITHSNETEKEIFKHILVLERELQEHYTLMKNEMVLQNDLVARLWILSQRYILLDR